jgi:hypothetical protein
MTRQTLEKAELFLQAWKEAGQYGEQAMLAVAFALRNRQRAGWEGGDWLRVIQNCGRLRYNKGPANDVGFPDLRNPVVYRFLTRVDAIYGGSAPDTYTSCTHPIEGVRTGKYWAELDKITDEKFLLSVVRCPGAHPKTSQVGGLTFFA